MLETEIQRGYDQVEDDIFEPQTVLEYLIAKKPELKETSLEYIEFSSHLDSANVAIHKYQNGLEEKQRRVENVDEEVLSHLRQITSSLTVSTAYLHIVETFTGQYTPTQIREIFKKCLIVNNMLTEEKLKATSFALGTNNSYARREKWFRLDKQGKKQYMEQHGLNPPNWYKGTDVQWIQILDIYGNFAVQLNQENIKRLVPSRVGNIVYFNEKVVLGNTLKDGTPGWFSQIDDNLPSLDTVNQQIEEEREEYDIYSQLKSLNKEQVARLVKLSGAQAFKGIVF